MNALLVLLEELRVLRKHQKLTRLTYPASHRSVDLLLQMSAVWHAGIHFISSISLDILRSI